MKTLIPTVTILTLASLGLPARAQADSDGYFCVGPNYLAYELSFSLGSSAHHLYVLRLDGSVIEHPVVVPLPSFQVHGMRCRLQEVQLLGWDSVYTVSLTPFTQPALLGSAPWQPAGTVPPDFAPANLGAWSDAVRVGHSDTVRLALASHAATYMLAIEVHSDPKHACRYHVRSTVLHLDSRGRPTRGRTILEGTAHRECGE